MELDSRTSMNWSANFFGNGQKLDHEIIASAIRQWRRRLRTCDTADGGHFGHAFWTC